MGVVTFVQPDAGSQTGSAYKAAIDGAVSVLKRISQAFAPHEQSTPNMTVRLDSGYIFTPANALTEVAAQSTATITAPTTNPRIDRIVIANVTGIVSVVTGTQAPSPTPPAIPSGKIPVAQVLLQTSTTTITNAIITDERLAIGSPGEFASGLSMIFNQAAAPTGWTINTGFNDRTLLIDSAAGGTSGGTWTIGGLTGASHTHTLNVPGSGAEIIDNSPVSEISKTTGGASATSVSSDGSWRPLWRKMIVADKN